MGSSVRREPFGSTERIVLERGDLELAVLARAAAVQSLLVPDRDGRVGDVVLGYPDLAGYEVDDGFLGAVVGRFANRIAHGRFTLDGEEYVVPPNDGAHALHGGPDGFFRQSWRPRIRGPRATDGEVSVELTHTSPAGHMGFPGTLEVSVTYTLLADGVRVDYRAVTDAPTVVNLTQHAYFNLAGAGSVADHVVSLAASRYLPVDDTAIPLGPLEPVDGTDFDFRAPKPVGRDRGGDFDHCWVLDDPRLDVVAARVEEPASGRVVEVLTDAPGVQFYTGGFLGSGPAAKPGRPYARHEGLCLETQWLPDSPNRPAYPSTVLRPGEELRTSTVWRFTTAPRSRG